MCILTYLHFVGKQHSKSRKRDLIIIICIPRGERGFLLLMFALSFLKILSLLTHDPFPLQNYFFCSSYIRVQQLLLKILNYCIKLLFQCSFSRCHSILLGCLWVSPLTHLLKNGGHLTKEQKLRKQSTDQERYSSDDNLNGATRIPNVIFNFFLLYSFINVFVYHSHLIYSMDY